MSLSLSSKGKVHREHKKKKRAQGELKVLLAHNNVVAKINNTPPVFTLWDRPYDVKCAAEKCKKDNGVYSFILIHIILIIGLRHHFCFQQ